MGLIPFQHRIFNLSGLPRLSAPWDREKNIYHSATTTKTRGWGPRSSAAVYCWCLLAAELASAPRWGCGSPSVSAAGVERGRGRRRAAAATQGSGVAALCSAPVDGSLQRCPPSSHGPARTERWPAAGPASSHRPGNRPQTGSCLLVTRIFKNYLYFAILSILNIFCGIIHACLINVLSIDDKSFNFWCLTAM